MEITEIQVDGYEKIVRCQDRESGLYALIAVHDTTLGPALGGLRMWPYASEDEALFDILRFSRGMTIKSAVAETGMGGGKSVILGDPARDKTEKLLRAMGRFIESQGGLYVAAEDMNIALTDLQIVREETRWVTGLLRLERGFGNPGQFTAEGCLVGLRAVGEELDGEPGLAGRKVVIQGVGAVGGTLAVLLKNEGAQVVICDIDKERMASLEAEHGFEVVDDDHHLEIECDFYAPCARGAGINDDTIPRLNCRAVAGCANDQLLEPHHAEALRERGILYAPDFVLNAGGIINAGLELSPGGYEQPIVRARLDRIYHNLKEVFAISRRDDIPTNEAARQLAERRISAARVTQG